MRLQSTWTIFVHVNRKQNTLAAESTASQRHVLKLPPQTPYKMWSTAEALRRIERRLETMLGANDQKTTAVDVKALNKKLSEVYEKYERLILKNMQDDEATGKDDLPQIKDKIGQETALLFHGLRDSANTHSDPICVLLCSTAAYRCECNQTDLKKFCACGSNSVIQIDQVRLNGTSIFLTPADDDDSAPELEVQTDHPYS